MGPYHVSHPWSIGLSLDPMTQPYQGLWPHPAPLHLISIFIDVCRWLLSCRRRGAKRPPRTADSWWELGWMACQVNPWRPLLAWGCRLDMWIYGMDMCTVASAADWLAVSIFSQTILIDCRLQREGGVLLYLRAALVKPWLCNEWSWPRWTLYAEILRYCIHNEPVELEHIDIEIDR